MQDLWSCTLSKDLFLKMKVSSSVIIYYRRAGPMTRGWPLEWLKEVVFLTHVAPQYVFFEEAQMVWIHWPVAIQRSSAGSQGASPPN